jgi:methylmalonyl-CoA/ethylmalonyl-CoA epimerase
VSSLGPVHHVGLACRSIQPVRAFLHSTHDVTCDSGITHDPLQHADLCLLTLRDRPSIELVSGEPVADLVRKGQSWYHVCYEVADIECTIAELGEHRCRVVSGPVPAILFGGRRVAFLYGPTGLIELLEPA